MRGDPRPVAKDVCAPVTGARFRKSSKSVEINCVEIAQDARVVLVRDSKHRAGHVLNFSAAIFAEFLAGARSGEFDSAR
jgi:hypothetical protein